MDKCLIHEGEETPGNPYKVCGECFHNFPTEQDFIDDDYQAQQAFLKRAGLIIKVVPNHPDNILSCPHCNHDFF